MVRYFICAVLLFLSPLHGCASLSPNVTPLTCEVDGHLLFEAKLKKITYIDETPWQEDDVYFGSGSLSDLKFIKMKTFDSDTISNADEDVVIASHCVGNSVRVKLMESTPGRLQVGRSYDIYVYDSSKLDTAPFSEWSKVK